MAGLGYKLFASGEVLTAANLQGYAVDQSVMKFATTAARSAALTAPTQGMLSWIDATGSLEVYYEAYNASTNTGGAAVAGWYPATGAAMFAGSFSANFANNTNINIGATSYLYTEKYDAYGWHSTSSNTSRIIPTVAGFYQLSGYVTFGSNATGVLRRIQANVNGSTIGAVGGSPATGTGLQTPAISLVTYLNGSTDYVEFAAFQDSGGSLSGSGYCSVSFIRPTSV